MTTTMRWIGCAMVMALMTATVEAQGHDMSKMGKDTVKKAPMSGMTHDMTGMTDSAMMARMKGMKPSDEPKSGWKELDHFHALMQGTWHGAMENDLRLAKAMTADVVKGAVAWEASKGPAKCDHAAARKELPGVTAAAKAYASVVAKQGSDADVKAALRKVHDSFEKVAMMCMKDDMKGMKQ